MKFTLFLWLLYSSVCWSQDVGGVVRDGDPPPALYPATSATHPLGVLTLRVDPNFRPSAATAPTVAFEVSSGNVWLPAVTAYLPTVEADRQYVSQFPWHEREYKFDPEARPSRSMAFRADGVLRQYQLRLSLPLAKQQEVVIGVRAFSLDEGRPPVSLLTSDRFIEWFHSNVAGGEDPFARKHYGLDGAGIHYADQRGRELRIDRGDVHLAGIEAAYRVYPALHRLRELGLFLSFGGHLGLSTSRWNPSLDGGVQATLRHRSQLSERSMLDLGVSGGVVSQQLLASDSAIQFSDKPYRASGALLLQWTLRPSPGRYLSVATTCTREGSYFRNAGFDYAVLTGQRVSTHWSFAISHLYEPRLAGNLLVTYGRGRVAVSAYLREDILADNAPDLQVGFGIRTAL